MTLKERCKEACIYNNYILLCEVCGNPPLPSIISVVESSEVKQAVKHDEKKPDLSLLPYTAKIGISKAFMDGEKKYGRYNYLQGMEWTRLIAAIMRHISAFNAGEDNAPDSGLNHLYHAGAGIMMLIEYYEKKLGKDNRYGR